MMEGRVDYTGAIAVLDLHAETAIMSWDITVPSPSDPSRT